VVSSARRAVREWHARERERIKAEKAGRVANATMIGIAAKGAAARATLAYKNAKAQVERQAAIVRGLSGPKRRGALSGAALAAEKRAHKQHEATADMSADQLVVFRKIRSSLKPSERLSLREAYDHWVHEHDGEVHTILRAHYEREIARLVKAERAQRAHAGQDFEKLDDADLHRLVHASLAPVPF
jgi:hypothetical protein